jgi:hypothetical protein
MKLKDASFLFRIYSFLMSNNKVQSLLTDMMNIFMTLYEIVFSIKPLVIHIIHNHHNIYIKTEVL